MLAKIAYAGFCATDIELLTGEMVHIKNGNTKYPIIPGHEWSGTIVEVGKNVRDFKVGDRITSDVSLGCGECDECRKGHYNLCPNREVIGSYKNRQGVFARICGGAPATCVQNPRRSEHGGGGPGRACCHGHVRRQQG